MNINVSIEVSKQEAVSPICQAIMSQRFKDDFTDGAQQALADIRSFLLDALTDLGQEFSTDITIETSVQWETIVSGPDEVAFT